ncbi:hypothetical protein SAMN02910292_02489 [Lachnospiraceae bacterium XBB2008]|nr:hypothetical protein SAMN02910292_02489 [Lachnospiraceae bacterium XBB2008]
MNEEELFKDDMTSKQMALLYYEICDSYSGEDRKKLDDAFDKAFVDAQKREVDYCLSLSEEGRVYCSQ